MSYERTYTVKDEHIDFQGIMDGLYYPFYLEECRHQFAEEVLKFDLHENAKNGINIVLSEYTIKFRRSLKKGDTFVVSCTAHLDNEGKPQLYFKQDIKRDGKLITEAIFTATCVLAKGGRPFLPEDLVGKIRETNAEAV